MAHGITPVVRLRTKTGGVRVSPRPFVTAFFSELRGLRWEDVDLKMNRRSQREAVGGLARVMQPGALSRRQFLDQIGDVVGDKANLLHDA